MIVIHSTNVPKLLNIIEDKEVKRFPTKQFPNMLDEPTGFIFAHIVFEDIASATQSDQLHWPGMCIIQFKEDILKDVPFIATRIGNFDAYTNMDDTTFASLEVKGDVFAKGMGNKDQIPNLQVLQAEILKYIEESKEMFGAFQHSHEVLFKEDIPVNYIDCIWVYNSKVRDALLESHTNIPIKILPSEAHFNPQLFLDTIIGV